MHTRVVPYGTGLAVRPLWTRRHAALALAVAVAAAVVVLVSQSSFASELKLRASVLRRVAAGRSVDASYFEPGACVEYQPMSGDHHLTVFLDAGHGGEPEQLALRDHVLQGYGALWLALMGIGLYG